MRRYSACVSLIPLLIPFLSGCSAIDNKTASLSVIYGVCVVLSLLLLIGYCSAAKQKDPWFVLLFASVLMVNIGYFFLSISRNLEEALLANRLSYLGSVFLPLSMLMIILSVTRYRYSRWVPGMLIGLGVIVFLIAASPGYLDIYYKEVFFEKVNGVTILKKIYGPLHSMYMVYLLGYFSAMVTTIVHATLNNKIDSVSYAVILAVAVFVNIGVWLIEQFVRIDFEILSLSYIISESFLLGLRLLMAETAQQQIPRHPQTAEDVPAAVPAEQIIEPATPPVARNDQAQIDLFVAGLDRLTPKERSIYECYIAGKTTSEIMQELNIKENTLKFHNKNLYGKLGVSSRRQLMELYRRLSATSRPSGE